jgi:hypothetical protein
MSNKGDSAMNPPRNSITADRGHNKPTPKCVVCFVEQKSANHTIPKARRSTPQAERGAVLPEDWHEMSLGALWDHLNCPRETPQTAIEAVIHSVREQGVAALKEPANIERLLECDDDSRIEINERIARLIAVESLTRWRTPLSDKQRIRPHAIVAKIEPTRGSFRSHQRRACGFSSSKKMPGTRA